MTKTITATEARIHFGEVMRNVVERGETIVVERGGKPVVVVISISEYNRLQGNGATPDDWWERAKRLSDRIQHKRGDRPWPNVDDLFHEMREERDAEIIDGLLRR